MTEPIRNKFDRLDDELAVRHGQLLDKLDAVIDALGVPADYTAAFATLGSKLDTVAAKLDTANILLTSAYGWMTELLPVLSDRHAALMLPLARLTTMDDNLQQVQQTLGLHNGGAEFTLASLARAQALTLSNLYTLLGGIGAPWPADVLAALVCICNAATAALPVGPLDPAANPPCTEPFTSDGQVIIPFSFIGGTNVNIATWSTLPAGLSYGSTFQLADDTSELQTSDWSGWSVYVESDQAQYSDGYGLLGVERYPTNQWRALSGSGARAFSVDARGGIKVYLCYVDTSGLPTECTMFSGFQTVTYGYPGGSAPITALVWPSGMGAVSSSEGINDPASGIRTIVGGETAMLPGNFLGWKMRSIGGAVQVFTGPLSDINYDNIVEGGYHTFTRADMTMLLVVAGAGVTAIELCPPDES